MTNAVSECADLPDEPRAGTREPIWEPRRLYDILRLLCSGAILENSIHLIGYVFLPDGRPKDLALPWHDPFCSDF